MKQCEFDYSKPPLSPDDMEKTGKLYGIFRVFDFENCGISDGQFDVEKMGAVLGRVMIHEKKVRDMIIAAARHYLKAGVINSAFETVIKELAKEMHTAIVDNEVERMKHILAENCDCPVCIERRERARLQ